MADVEQLVQYMLFGEEVPLKEPIQGMSGFTKMFSERGPRDRKGRSLRDFDLKTRLFRYPCSYLIYSPAFDHLPAPAKDAIYERMWQILSGAEKGSRYARLSQADRRAIVEILRETKPDYVLILPWNLKDEIVQQLQYIREWGGRFVVPIPRVQIY